MYAGICTLHISLKALCRHGAPSMFACWCTCVCLQSMIAHHTRSCTHAPSACSFTRSFAPTHTLHWSGWCGAVDKACAVVDSSACSGSFFWAPALVSSVLHWRVFAFVFCLEQICGIVSELEVPGLAFCLCIDMTSNKFQYAFTSKRISLIHGMVFYSLYSSHTLFLTCLHKYVIRICFYFVLISYVDLHVLLIYGM